MLKVLLASLALTVLGAGAAPAQAAGVAAPLKIDVPVNAIAYDAWPLWTAIDEHLFERYGVEASTPGAMASPTVVASILSGETIFAIVGEDAVIDADLNGADVVILTADTEKLLLAVYSPSQLHNVADLKGKKLAISQFGTTTDFLGHYIADQAGLAVGRDIVLLPVGSLANRLAALQSGAAEGALLGPPITFTAEGLGFHAIARMTDYGLLFYSSTLIAQRSWVEAHRAETLDVVRGYIAGGAAIARDKPAALAVLAKYTRTTDPQILDRTYQGFMSVFLRKPVPRVAGLQAGLASSKVPAAKTADPTRFIDPSFVTELDQDGFIANLYK
jgi:ABC-type nitrate/sulfonate/bicarbonate transport system substrate-binding protein